MPSVITVRSKNRAGSWYSGGAIPMTTLVRSAANAASWKLPSSTSS